MTLEIQEILDHEEFFANVEEYEDSLSLTELKTT